MLRELEAWNGEEDAGEVWSPPADGKRRSRRRAFSPSRAAAPRAAAPAAPAASEAPASGGGRATITSILVIVSLLAVALYATAGTGAFASWFEWAVAGWQSLMDRSEQAVVAAGPWAPAYFLGLYTVSSVFCLPLFGFHAIAGYTYGTLHCAALVTVCQTAGAAAAFIFARHFVRPTVEAYLRRKWGVFFVAMDRAIAKQATSMAKKIVFLIRASPVLPFSVTNYLCGCTEIDLFSFTIATWLGCLPGTTSYCSVGAAGKLAAAGGQTDAQKWLLGLGVLAALLMVKTVSDMATRALAEAGVTKDAAAPSGGKKKAA